MSTRNPFDESSKKHDDVPAAAPSPPEAHPLAEALTESLRQADEPPCEATPLPNPSLPDCLAGTAGTKTECVSVSGIAIGVGAGGVGDGGGEEAGRRKKMRRMRRRRAFKEEKEEKKEEEGEEAAAAAAVVAVASIAAIFS